MNKNDFLLYTSIINLFHDVKLMEGNLALNSSIRRHKKLSNFVKQYQKTLVLHLEECFNDDGSASEDIVKYCNF